MKYKKIMIFFAISAPIAIFIRTLQVLFTIDDKGFTLTQYRKLGYEMIVLIIAAVGVATVLGFLTHRCPEKAPRVRPILASAAIILGVWTIADMALFELSPMVPAWQSIAMKLFGLLSGLLWIAYGLQRFIPVKLPPLVYVIPVIFWVVRLIWAFTTLNTLALTIGHVLLLLAYCSVLVFMLEFAKQLNGIDKEYNFKKLLASGICASSLCGVFSVPYMIATVLGSDAAAVEGYSPILMLFFTGVFILVFTLSHFSNGNLRKHRHHRHRTEVLEIEDRVDRFYTGD